ncbi:MAG: gliding motility-associated C-terminal domain-containing protein [Maribacter sp.]
MGNYPTYKYIFCILLLSVINVRAQLIRNFGDLEIHDNGQFGIYNTTVNDGQFLSSGGLVGLYGETPFSIIGEKSPILRDLEIANQEGINLGVPISITNNINFIYGDILTDKSNSSVFLEMVESAFYTGATNFSKTNGRLKIDISSNFIAPVGDADLLRPISINPLFPTSQYTTAYYFDNPLLVASINTDTHISVMDTEYWILEGENPVSITLSWNERSGLFSKVDALNTLSIAGYNKTTLEWENLGNNNLLGDVNNGFISSNEFLPSEYEVITFGILEEAAIAPTKPEIPNQYNYYLSVNGDGINDFLYIKELENYPDNEVQIYDRNGLLVFQMENYTNEFDGSTGVNVGAVHRAAGLPIGVYFYLASVNNGQYTIQGFLYLNRGE